MIINKKHLQILKDFLDRKIDSEDIADKDKPIIIELCKARKKQLEDKIEIKTKKIRRIKKENH
jgi:hypothetical protein